MAPDGTALDDHEADLDERDEELSSRASELEDQEGELQEPQTAVDEREAAVTEEDETIAANTFPGLGTFIVGEEMEPGTYRTDASSYCYWERLSGLSGEFHDIITNDLSEGTSYVTIAQSDMAFSAQNCGEWTRQ